MPFDKIAKGIETFSRPVYITAWPVTVETDSRPVYITAWPVTVERLTGASNLS